ncbi:MAG TPA: hypothetical protein VGS41_08465, partial [Chthonomonadales bacterium]|nr:hypothetical protein [Chthonomonadales bacterium]
HALALCSAGAPQIWKSEGQPNRELVRCAGNRLHATYMMMASVTDVELTQAPAETDSGAEASIEGFDANPLNKNLFLVERTARAEATGALVRVSDGRILWQSRGTATMSVRVDPSHGAAPWTSRRKVVESAMRFALLDLQRQFGEYTAHFSKY